MSLRFLLAIGCLWALTATAASSVDALRGHSVKARETVKALRSEQMAKRNELSEVSSRIEALKAKRRNALLPGSELDGALKRSQELSGLLSALAQRMSVDENELVAANAALLEALSQQLNRARADFDRQTDRAARKASIGLMKQLRTERESVRAALPVTQVASLDTLKPSDDPEELLEQAELLRDNEEKLAKDLKQVETRLAERKDERELDRRVQRFLGEEAMFDDQDRRLRLQRTSTLSTATAETAGSSSATGSAPVAGSQSAGSPSAPGAFGAASADGVSARGAIDDPAIRVSSSADARPQVGAGRSLNGRDADEVAALDAQRAALQKLVDELKAKAMALEKRASTLK